MVVFAYCNWLWTHLCAWILDRDKRKNKTIITSKEEEHVWIVGSLIGNGYTW
jgi:hypothetical protein